MSVNNNSEVRSFNKIKSVRQMYVSGSVSSSGSIELGQIVFDKDSILIFSSSNGNIVVSGNLNVLGNLSQNGSSIGGSAGVLSSSNGVIVSSGTLDFSETNESYHIRSINSNLIFSSSVGDVVISGNLRVLGGMAETASTENFRHVSGSSGITAWYIANTAHANSNTTLITSVDRLYAVPFIAPSRGGTIGEIAYDVTAGNAATGTLGIYTNTSDSILYPDSLIYSSASVVAVASLKKCVANINLDPGRMYWFTLLFSGSGSPTIRSVPGSNCTHVLGADITLRSNTANFTHLIVSTYTPTTPLFLSSTFPAGAVGSTTDAPAIAVLYTS